jgi:tetratricopeptide (TPR) repeat protein
MKDGDIPELKIGIEYAQAGQMDEAVKKFEEAVQNAKTNPKLKASDVARAYWDLGLAYEYSDQFDKAIDAFKSAFNSDPSNEQYLQEENRIKARQREYQKLQEQEKTK